MTNESRRREEQIGQIEFFIGQATACLLGARRIALAGAADHPTRTAADAAIADTEALLHCLHDRRAELIVEAEGREADVAF